MPVVYPPPPLPPPPPPQISQPISLLPFSSIPLRTSVMPRRNWKQWLRKMLGGKQGALFYVKMVHPMNSATGLPNAYPQGSDLSGG